MMDATASILAILSAAIAIAENLHKIFCRLKNAPSEIIALLEEVQSIRIVLKDIREKEHVLAPWVDISALAILLRRAQRDLEESNRFLVSFISQGPNEELVFNRMGWYLKKNTAEKLYSRIESIKTNAVAILSCANLSANVHITLSVQSIATALNEKMFADNELLNTIAQFQNTSTQSIAAIEESFRRFAISPPPENYARLLQDKRPNTEVIDTSLIHYNAVTSSMSSDMQTPYSTLSTGCSLNCNCKCHRHYGLRSPYFASPILGRFNIIYTGASADSSPCSSPYCSRHRGFMLNMSYSFPRWLLFRMLHVLGSTMGDPKFVLSVPKVISQDANIFEMARLGDIENMKNMFSHGWASPLVVTEHGETLIQETIHNGHPAAARFLIQMGANPEVENDVGVLPAQEAWDYILRQGHPQGILEEYRVIFSLNEEDLDDRGFTVVHKYVLGLLQTDNFLESIEKNRAIINAVDRTGRTAAHWAVLRNDAEKLYSLLQMGANPNIKDGTWGNTLLDYSVRCASTDLTKILLKFGADVNSRTTCKWTPLYGCATYRKSSIPEAHVENARLILSYGGQIDARDEDGVDALIKAVRQEIPLLAAYLLDEAGAEINTWDNEGVSALAYAIRRQSVKTLEVLLDRGADYLVKDKRLNTILHATAAEADFETLQVLGNYKFYGLDSDSKNWKGLTPTEIATTREDLPAGFLPLFTELCADTRKRFRNNERTPEAATAQRLSNDFTEKDKNFVPNSLYTHLNESSEEFQDAEEFNSPSSGYATPIPIQEIYD